MRKNPNAQEYNARMESIMKCGCPIYCRFCGARLKKDHVGHYCPQDNCQWRYGVEGCTEEEIKERNERIFG